MTAPSRTARDTARTARDTSGDLAGAVAALEQGRVQDAAPLIRAVLARDRRCAAAWTLAGQMYLDSGEAELAAKATRVAIELQAGDPLPHRILSLACGQSGDRAGASDAARVACAIAPDSAVSLLCLGQALNLSADTRDEALAVTERAISLAPDAAGGHIVAGMIAHRDGRPADARRELRTALRLDPESAVARRALDSLRSSALATARDTAGPRTLAARANDAAAELRVAPRDPAVRARILTVVDRVHFWTAMLVVLDALVTLRFVISHTSLASRLAPVVLLAIPLIYRFRFSRGLGVTAAEVVASAVGRRSHRAFRVCLGTGTVALFLAAALPMNGRSVAGIVACALTCAGMLISQSAHRRQRTGPVGPRRSARPRTPTTQLILVGAGLLAARIVFEPGLPTALFGTPDAALNSVIGLSLAAVIVASVWWLCRSYVRRRRSR